MRYDWVINLVWYDDFNKISLPKNAVDIIDMHIMLQLITIQKMVACCLLWDKFNRHVFTMEFQNVDSNINLNAIYSKYHSRQNIKYIDH